MQPHAIREMQSVLLKHLGFPGASIALGRWSRQTKPVPPTEAECHIEHVRNNGLFKGGPS